MSSRPPAPWFHIGGVAVTLVAAAVAGASYLFLALATSAPCDGEAPPGNLRDLRLGTLGIGLALAAVPGAWSWLARRRGYGAAAWVVVAGTLAVATLGAVAATRQVPHGWCF